MGIAIGPGASLNYDHGGSVNGNGSEGFGVGGTNRTVILSLTEAQLELPYDHENGRRTGLGLGGGVGTSHGVGVGVFHEWRASWTLDVSSATQYAFFSAIEGISGGWNDLEDAWNSDVSSGWPTTPGSFLR
jgi:hypothetical protein